MKPIFQIILITIILAHNALQSQTPGVVFPTPETNQLNSDFSIGWRFQVNTNIAITSLGVYDENSDGLNSSHPVGLYNDAGILLASVTVPSGTAGTLVNNFRYANLGSTLYLTSGQIYRVAALHLIAGGDNYSGCFSPCGDSYPPEISYLGNRFTGSPVLVFPTGNQANIVAGIHGGNFLFSLTVVPTLGQWGLIILGLLIISISSIFFVQRRNALAIANSSK